ncbi:hypothetical protein Acsp06_62900 [Actinomycetospora sp. NBRC 106375]|uniref:RNA polymerase sigma factor n=1 Tax=Actinomycetospora sp. NBRC 106375 TaxID=3032207 RepID=UPI0024A4293E|nr:sigma-70 family RNA polymerase sigma factor [Actinomycetospora sp. NBRC 106375]GLZ50105.1 hypothetical protein Acsp06_62900 [Actinomycetospora sp. NBRC 106375]
MLVSDAALAVAAMTNPTAFAAIYRRYGDALYNFCVGMLRDPDAAADCVQDVFCTAATRLGQLREHDKLRPWLYAIARHEALARLRRGRREEPSDDLPDVPATADGPEALAARTELAALVAHAAGGLSNRDRAVLELHYHHGLDGPALADALGVSATNANTMVGRLRTTIERCLGAVLVARHQRERCTELAALLEGWNGTTLTVLLRKRLNRHIEGCEACGEARRELVSPHALLRSAPVLVPAPAWLGHSVTQHATPLLKASAGVAHHSWWPASLGTGTPTAIAVVASPLVAVATASLVAISPLTSAPTVEPPPVAAQHSVTTSTTVPALRPVPRVRDPLRTTTTSRLHPPIPGAPAAGSVTSTPSAVDSGRNDGGQSNNGGQAGSNGGNDGGGGNNNGGGDNGGTDGGGGGADQDGGGIFGGG